MESSFITLEDCFVAYRKAKTEAFYENSHLQGPAFAQFEKRLTENLRDLLRALRSDAPSWTEDLSWLGNHYYAPKFVNPPEETNGDGLFFRCLDPLEEWLRLSSASGVRARAGFRLMIRPTVNFQVVSALWIMKVGQYFDSKLATDLSYGSRLRRQPRADEWSHPHSEPGALNLDCPGLFAPYFSAYRKWRENGLDRMKEALASGERVVAITMDISKFYHRVSPNFVLKESFHRALGVELSADQLSFTSQLVSAINTWYRSTPDCLKQPTGALPVGLSASKVLSNILLAELDRSFVERVKPLYYGRYVDDFFIVLAPDAEIVSGRAMMEYIVSRSGGMMSLPMIEGVAGLRVTLPYADDSELVFGGEKQKFFNLAGDYGLDLVEHISEQIRRQSSEHRLLPVLPATGPEMASRALLAQPEATLEVDAIRKADTISVRRLGFAFLMRDVESYGRDLLPRSWRLKRNEFYGLVHRHVLTPKGFFDFFRLYVHRVFALMISCGDQDQALTLIDRLKCVLEIIQSTTTAGTSESDEFSSCVEYCANELLQALLRATTVRRFRWTRRMLRIFAAIRELSPAIKTPRTLLAAKKQSLELFYADFGSRPYRDAWLNGAPRKLRDPELPRTKSFRYLLRLGGIRAFRKEAGLPPPYLPAITFATRPIGLSDITFYAPTLLHKPSRLRAALFAFRGARARQHDGFGLAPTDGEGKAPELRIYNSTSSAPRIGLPSLYTSHQDWLAAVSGKSSLTPARLERFRRLINGMCTERKKPSYIVFPECSVPREWAKGIALKLAQRRISFIAGLEYEVTPKGVRNDAFVSLTTEWPWYPTSVNYIQPKFAPAHEEKRELAKNGKKRLYKPTTEIVPVYVHGDFCFGVLICSDLTTIGNRFRYQGMIDALFVLEWNPDIETFSFLIEAAAHDLHSYVVQVNNRAYGDSRVRVPAKESYERDVVRVKGGLSDYYVIAELDCRSLRAFQRRPVFGNGAKYKPLPIGYAMSSRRRQDTK